MFVKNTLLIVLFALLIFPVQTHGQTTISGKITDSETGLGLDYVSCSPFRVPIARLAAAHAAIKE